MLAAINAANQEPAKRAVAEEAAEIAVMKAELAAVATFGTAN